MLALVSFPTATIKLITLRDTLTPSGIGDPLLALLHHLRCDVDVLYIDLARIKTAQ